MVCSLSNAFAQNDTAFNKQSSVTDVDSKAISGLQKKYSDLQGKVDAQSAKLLSRMQAKEDRLKRKLQSSDSTKAQELFTDDVLKSTVNNYPTNDSYTSPNDYTQKIRAMA
jgi:hypothetical protein